MNIITIQNGLHIARIYEHGLEEWIKSGWIKALDQTEKKPTKPRLAKNENS